MFITCIGENKQMEEELATIKSKLDDLDQQILGLQLHHSPMNNHRQPESSKDTGFSSSSNFREPKLDFPHFNGDDLIGWIYRVEQYFSLHNTCDFNKVPLASFHLEHEALQWFCWYIKDHEEPQWIDFCQLLLQRFGPSGFDDFTGALTKLRQIGTMREHQIEFEKFVKHMEGLSNAFYRSCFISGLKDTIQSKVKMFCPNTMMEILGFTKLVEDKIKAQ